MSSSRPLSLIVAMNSKRVIGLNNSIPWRHPADLRHFRRTTEGHAIIMGRATYESIGRPLPKRHNIVVTRQTSYVAEGCQIAHDLNAALQLAYALDPQPCIIGGAQLYMEALPLVTRLYLTTVPGDHEGDSYFPEFDRSGFQEIERRVEGDLVFHVLERQQ